LSALPSCVPCTPYNPTKWPAFISKERVLQCPELPELLTGFAPLGSIYFTALKHSDATGYVTSVPRYRRLTQDGNRLNLPGLETPTFLKNFQAFYATSKVHYCVHNKMPLVFSILRLILATSPHSISFRFILILYSQLGLSLSGGL
jgi:hypothetical protein